MEIKKQFSCRVFKHNTGSLYIRFKHKKKPETISIGIKVQKGERWEQKRQRLVSNNREKRAMISYMIAHFNEAIPKFKITGDRDLLTVPIAPRRDAENYDTLFWLLDEYKRTVGKHLGTIKTLKYNLTEYTGYKHRKSFDPEDFYKYLKSTCKVSSANMKMTVLSRMIKVIWKQDIQYSKSRADEKPLFCFEPEELEALFSLTPVTRFEKKLLCMFELLYRTGLRFGDIETLKNQFNHNGNSTMITTAKSKKTITIVHTDRIVELVGELIPISLSHANTELKHLAERAKIDRVINGEPLWKISTCHTFRKTFATVLHRSGKVDVFQLKEILCHSSIETTQRYIVPQTTSENLFALT